MLKTEHKIEGISGGRRYVAKIQSSTFLHK